MMRELPHPFVDEGYERAESLGITLRPPAKELGDVAWIRQNVRGESQGDGRKVDPRESPGPCGVQARRTQFEPV